MKLPRLIALHYGLAAILLGSTITAHADSPKKEMVEAQQQKAVDAIDAAKKAEPNAEARPAAISSHKEHSVQSSKGEMIKGQEKATEKAIDEAEAATPNAEARPAVTTSQKEHSTQSSKGEMIKKQKKAVEKELSDAMAAETKPAATTKLN
jgi:hypothetical protein